MVTCSSGSEICRQSCINNKNENSCTFSIGYAEGSSLQGIIIEDYIKFENDTIGEGIKVSFGCTTK
jgi:hypothetical protein